MSAKEFYRITENNNNEGETWYFYVPMTTEEANHLFNLFNFAIDDWSDFPYEISDPIAEHTIDTLVEFANDDGGYMNTHNKCVGATGSIILLTLEDILDDDILYKGSFWNIVA